MYIPEYFWSTIIRSGYLKANDIFLLRTLLAESSHEGVATLTIENIAWFCKRTVKTTEKYIKSLVDKNVITEKARYKEPGDSETTCIYEINLDVDFWIEHAKGFLEENPKYIKKLRNMDVKQFSLDIEKRFEEEEKKRQRGEPIISKYKEYLVTAFYRDSETPEYYFLDTMEECTDLKESLMNEGDDIEAVYISHKEGTRGDLYLMSWHSAL